MNGFHMEAKKNQKNKKYLLILVFPMVKVGILCLRNVRNLVIYKVEFIPTCMYMLPIILYINVHSFIFNRQNLETILY